MTRLSLFALLINIFSLAYATIEHDFNGCNLMVYNDGGMFSARDTLLACSAQMASPLLPVSFDVNFDGNLTVIAQLGINNLIAVDEVASTIELDFYYRNTWTDTRWKMNETFWTEQRSDLGTVGLELLPLVKNEFQEDNLPLWLPDGWFLHQVGWDVHAASLKLYPDGSFFYSRHCTLTVKQSQLDLAMYPLDSQYIDLKLMSYAYTAEQVRFLWDDPPISYLEDENGEPTFTMHPIWGHTLNYYRATYFDETYLLNGFEVTYETNHLQIRIDRLGHGIFVRFAVPILILVILAGLTFWANFETRIDTTMTILLSVSALYVVILGSIPQVGYLTDFDQWIFSIFIMLSVCVFCHQLVMNSTRKIETWPFRSVIIRLIELAGRILVIPLSVYFFVETFNDEEFEDEFQIMMIAFLVIFSLVSIRELFGVRKSIAKSMKKIGEKVDRGELPCSWVELAALNFYYFGIFDVTTVPYEAKKKRIKRIQAEKQNDSNYDPQSSKRSSKILSSSRNSGLLARAFRRKTLYDSDDDDDAL